MIGRHISHYRIIDKIGEGGMGEVYLAQDLQLDRKVALKFLPAGRVIDDTARRRLLNEANAAARIDHPFITKVYEVGEADGHPFIAMELVEGTTLKDRLARGRMEIGEAIRIGSEMADALEFARSRGIVHRDLKPSNVMIGIDGHVKVMDFGIAKRVPGPGTDPDRTGTSGSTLTGEISGTPAYMAPEQVKGETLDSRADVFALGVCLYEMLTGAHPFLKKSSFATAEAIINQDPPPLELFMREPPELLDRILRRALAKDPMERYQSFRELRLDLDAFADKRTATGVPLMPVRVTRPRDRRIVWIAAAMVILAALAAVAWRAWPARFRATQPALAFNDRDWIVIADFENLTGDAVFDRSLRVALDVAIAQSRYVNVLPVTRLQDALRRMKRAPTDKLDEALASEVALREQVKAVLACTIASVGDRYALTAKIVDPQTRAAVRTESVQARNKDAVLPALDELATRVRQNLGESLASVSTQQVALPRATTASLEALRLYADSLRPQAPGVEFDLLQQAIKVDPDFAMAHAQLGHAYYLMADQSQRRLGEEHFKRALSLFDRLSQRERLWITALAEESRGNRDASVAAYRTYLASYPDDAAAWFRIGWSYLAGVHQPELAVEAFTRAIALNPSNANALVNLATAYSGLGRNREAVEKYNEAFALDPSLRTALFINHEYGFTLVRAGDLDGAAENFKRMLTMDRPADRARGRRSLALLEMYRGHYGAAIDELRQAIVINKTIGARVSEFRDRLFLARAYQAKGLTAGVATEVAAAHRLALDAALAPEWLRGLAKLEARIGRLRDAKATLAFMSKTAGDATASSSVNRDTGAEQAHFDIVKAEIERAEGRPAQAAELLESALVIDSRADTLESLAAALVDTGRHEEAAKRYAELIDRHEMGNEGQEHGFVARVRLAEIDDRLGKTDRARELYEELITQWQTGDDDLLLLRQARKDLARLKSR
ncbi:MAG TPA: protein kinase [Vicinamibacterales bacterium]|nr:protein kinase [Vicinamibacterales bacterium]